MGDAGSDILGWVFFFSTWGLGFLAYLVLQVLTLVRLRGGARIFAALPLLPMAVVAAWTAYAYMEESNLWPIVLILVGFPAAAYLVVVWLVGRKRPAAPTAF